MSFTSSPTISEDPTKNLRRSHISELLPPLFLMSNYLITQETFLKYTCVGSQVVKKWKIVISSYVSKKRVGGRGRGGRHLRGGWLPGAVSGISCRQDSGARYGAEYVAAGVRRGAMGQDW